MKDRQDFNFYEEKEVRFTFTFATLLLLSTPAIATTRLTLPRKKRRKK